MSAAWRDEVRRQVLAEQWQLPTNTEAHMLGAVPIVAADADLRLDPRQDRLRLEAPRPHDGRALVHVIVRRPEIEMRVILGPVADGHGCDVLRAHIVVLAPPAMRYVVPAQIVTPRRVNHDRPVLHRHHPPTIHPLIAASRGAANAYRRCTDHTSRTSVASPLRRTSRAACRPGHPHGTGRSARRVASSSLRLRTRHSLRVPDRPALRHYTVLAKPLRACLVGASPKTTIHIVGLTALDADLFTHRCAFLGWSSPIAASNHASSLTWAICQPSQPSSPQSHGRASRPHSFN